MVKKFISGLFIIALFVISACSKYNFEKTFSVLPDKPEPGQDLTIVYNPASTPLENSNDVNAFLYFFESVLDTTISIKMEKEGKGWIANTRVPDNAVSLFVRFVDDDGNKEDNNGEKAYIVNMHDNSGNELPETKAVFAVATAARGGIAGMKTDRENGISLLEQEFSTNPDLMKKFADEYFFNINRSKGSEAKEIISGKLTELEAMNDSSEDVLMTLVKWYRFVENTAKEEQYKSELESRFPDNSLAESDAYSEAYSEKDIEKQKELLAKFEERFKGSVYTPRIYYSITNNYTRAGNVDDLEKFLVANSTKTHMLSFYNAVNYILENSDNMEAAYNISKAGVERSKEDVISPRSPLPAYYSTDEWLEINKGWAAYNYLVYSKVLNKINKPDEAVANALTAVELTDREDSEVNENYVSFLQQSKKHEDVISQSEEFIKSGAATAKIKDALKIAYIKTKGGDEGFGDYLSTLEAEAMSELYKQVKELIINEPAADFTLSDLEGNSVSLADMKGKVVIVDFWATWCGPCLNSFPGMKLAVEKYQDDESVQFLFVNTWERVDNKLENATNFVKDNNYPFYVLMDTENKVVSDFGVSGIPTKFIIDGNGKIRFKSVGFDGNTEHLVDELSVMISLAKEG